MKYFELLLLCGCIVFVKSLTEEQKQAAKEQLKSMAEPCMTKEGATDEHFEEMSVYKEDPARETKCLEACLLQYFDILTGEKGDYKLSKDNQMALASFGLDGDQDKEKSVAEAFDVCESTSFDDRCDGAHLYGMCMKLELENRGLEF